MKEENGSWPLAKGWSLGLHGVVKIIRRIFVLIFLAGAASLCQWMMMGFPQLGQWADEWGIGIADVASVEGVIWVDVRSESAYALAHHPEAIHLDIEDWDTGIGKILEKWEPGRSIVVYCDGNGCESSRKVAAQLRTEFEMEFAYWLLDGWVALKSEEVDR